MQIYTVRSLNNAGAITLGLPISSVVPAILKDLTEGSLVAAVQWTVIVADPGTPVLTYEVDVKMTDGSWQKIPSTVVSSPTVGAVLSFFGPFIDMRGNITAWTSGNLTMDIIAMIA